MRITAIITGIIPENMTTAQAKALLQAAIDNAARNGIEGIQATLHVSLPPERLSSNA